jgi:hypothetical protein
MTQQEKILNILQNEFTAFDGKIKTVVKPTLADYARRMGIWLHPEHLNIDYVLMRSDLPQFDKTDRYGFCRKKKIQRNAFSINVWPVLVAIEDEFLWHSDIFGAELANLCQVNYPVKILLLRGSGRQKTEEFLKWDEPAINDIKICFRETIETFKTIREEAMTNRYVLLTINAFLVPPSLICNWLIADPMGKEICSDRKEIRLV